MERSVWCVCVSTSGAETSVIWLTYGTTWTLTRVTWWCEPTNNPEIYFLKNLQIFQIHTSNTLKSTKCPEAHPEPFLPQGDTSCIFESVSLNAGTVSLHKQTPSTERTGLNYVIQRGPGSGPHMSGWLGPEDWYSHQWGHTGSCAAAVLTSPSGGLMRCTPYLFQLTHISASPPSHAIKDSLITMAHSSFCELEQQHL